MYKIIISTWLIVNMLTKRLIFCSFKGLLRANLVSRNSLFFKARSLHILNGHQQNNFKYFFGRSLMTLFGMSLFGISLFLLKNQKLPECEDEINESNVYNISIKKYKALHRVIGNYLKDSAYVYKLCQDSDLKWWLIIMKRTSDTITDEGGSYINSYRVDEKKAHYRGSDFKVVMIVDIDNPTITKSSLKHTIETNYSNYGNTTIYITTMYRVGMNIFPDEKFEMNEPYMVYSEGGDSGISFYVDIFTALHDAFKRHNNIKVKERRYNNYGQLVVSIDW